MSYDYGPKGLRLTRRADAGMHPVGCFLFGMVLLSLASTVAWAIYNTIWGNR